MTTATWGSVMGRLWVRLKGEGVKDEDLLSEACGFGFLGFEPLAQIDWS